MAELGPLPESVWTKNECSPWTNVGPTRERDRASWDDIIWVHPRSLSGACTDLSRMNMKVLPDPRGWGRRKPPARTQMHSHCQARWGEQLKWEVEDPQVKERALNICQVYNSTDARSPDTHRMLVAAFLSSLPFLLVQLGRGQKPGVARQRRSRKAQLEEKRSMMPPSPLQ